MQYDFDMFIFSYQVFIWSYCIYAKTKYPQDQ